jgi:endonuclease G
MKIKITIAALLLCVNAFANPIDDNCPQFAPYGAPISSLLESDVQYLCKLNYALQYNNKTKTASYVLEYVTKESITGTAKRKDDFRPDPAIPKQNQSLLSDYAGHPYDRGHLSPAGDNTKSAAVMSESFFLSNMVPQNQNNNRGIWKQLETKVRDYVLNTGDLYVASGPIYDKDYKTIGANKVGVPTKLYKVIIDVKNNKASAYIFPNSNLPVQDLPRYRVTIAEVEMDSGINFNPTLKDTAIEKSKSW